MPRVRAIIFKSVYRLSVSRFLDQTEAFPAGVRGITARFLTLASGLRVRLVESGPAGGAPVVLLSGWGASTYLYRKNIPALASAGLRVIAVDLRGQGWSDKPLARGEYTLESLAAHTIEILDALGLGTVALVGLSLGGAIAAQVALRSPDRVRRVVLLDAVGLGPVRLVGWMRWLPVWFGAVLRPFARRWTFGALLRFAYGDLNQPSARDVDEYYAPARDPAFVRSLWLQLREVDWRVLAPAELERLSMPVLAMFGTRDRLISAHGVESRLRSAPHARLVLVAGAGHVVAEEASEVVNRAMVEFLK